MTQAEKERLIRHFEGLVKETSNQIIESGVELDFDDVAQLIRIKVWHAVEKFSAARAAASEHLSHALDKRGRTPLERFVYMCVANMRKDIEKQPRRFNSSIEQIRDQSNERLNFLGASNPQISDWFDLRYLSVDHEDVFGAVEQDGLSLPSTLTEIERRVVELRMEGLMLMEIDRALGLSRAQRERVMRSVHEKLVGLRPPAREDAASLGPAPPLPGGARQSRAVRSPQAA